MVDIEKTAEKYMGKIDEKVKESDKLSKLRHQRQTLDGNLTKYLDQQKEQLAKPAVQEVQQSSALDMAISNIHTFETTAGELVGQLTADLDAYVGFISKSKNFKGLEKLVKIFSNKSAQAMRTKRVFKQETGATLMEAIAYGWDLVEELQGIYGVADMNYFKLNDQVKLITMKLEEYQPQEEQLSAKKEAMQEQYDKLEAEYSMANAKDQVTLQVKKEKLSGELDQVKEAYRRANVAYNQAQQALKPIETAKESYQKMREDVAAQIELVTHKLENITTAYETAPDAIKIALATKGLEVFDQTINTLSDKIIDLHTDAARGVSDATLKREETPLIQAAVMKGYMDRMKQTVENFNERYGRITKDARKSQTERYDSK